MLELSSEAEKVYASRKIPVRIFNVNKLQAMKPNRHVKAAKQDERCANGA